MLTSLSHTERVQASAADTKPPDNIGEVEFTGVRGESVLIITATGRQSRLMCRPDKYGFSRTKAKQGRVQFGFQTGDMVRANVTRGKKAGTYIGRVAVRSSGNFNIATRAGTVQGISYRHCKHLHRSDGYRYAKGEAASSTR